MVDIGDNREVIGLLCGLSLMIIVNNMVQYCQILQISPTEEVLSNQDCVRYNIYELKCIRSDCQKDPQCKIIPWSTSQCIRSCKYSEKKM